MKITMLILLIFFGVGYYYTKSMNKNDEYMDDYLSNMSTKAQEINQPIDLNDYSNQLYHPSPSVESESIRPKPKYKCDGREYCSQMNSCEEATFFINNCPNTKMDGDSDGVPCWKQWCGHK